MDADGSNPATVAECDTERFCDVPTWGTYSGPLTAVAAAARARSRVTASAAGRRGRRLRRAIRRELAGGGKRYGR